MLDIPLDICGQQVYKHVYSHQFMEKFYFDTAIFRDYYENRVI